MAAYINRLPDIEIEDGVVRVSYAGEADRVMSVQRYRKNIAYGLRVLAKHDASGEVVPIRQKR